MSGNIVEGMFFDEMLAKCEKMPDFRIVTFENGEYPDEPLTYRDLYENTCKVARYLKDQGIGKGDAFSLVMRNHPEFLYCLGAASILGAIVVPIDPRSKGSKLSYQIKDSSSKGVVFTGEFRDEVVKSLGELPGVKALGVVYKPGFEGPAANAYPSLNEVLAGPAVPPIDGRNDDLKAPFEIIYTSGTTGDPKGVVVKGNRMPMFKLLAQFVWGYTEGDKLYTGLSLTHGNAQAVTLTPSLMLNIPSVISRKFTKSKLWDIMRKHGCTTFSLLGGMMMGIYSEPRKPDDHVNPVKKVISAGTPRAIWEDFEKRFDVRIHEWYAAVEGGFAHNPPGGGPVGSFGKTLEGVMEMKVVREDESECGPGEIGELIFIPREGKAEVEYVGKKDASEAKTRGGILRSGDMCHRDESGWHYFDFRKGGGLRRHGDFIQPEYVEKVLADLEEVTDVCVYGIPSEAGAPGESDIVAAIVPSDSKAIDAKAIFRKLAAGLDNNSIPSYLQVVKEIPKSASEKNLDRFLRDEFRKDARNVFSFAGHR
jgi:acyl-CoA synthetase (AMP-forming)/AMP-acid ligase II